MSREIVEAMRALAPEKGITPDRLIAALEDALLSAYKKQPGVGQVRPGRASTARPATSASSSCSCPSASRRS